MVGALHMCQLKYTGCLFETTCNCKLQASERTWACVCLSGREGYLSQFWITVVVYVRSTRLTECKTDAEAAQDVYSADTD